MASITGHELFWLGVGLGGQLLFSLRVANQWWASERSGKCVVPMVYWIFGLCGGLCLIAYGCYRQDPVILIGQIFGSFVSYRNLILSRRADSPSIQSHKPHTARDLWIKKAGPALHSGSPAS